MLRPARSLTAAALGLALVMSSTAAVDDASAASPYTPPAPRPAMIAAGREHTVAVTPAGTVRAWGSNQYGQLGDGSTDPASTPVSVLGFSDSAPLGHAVQVAAGNTSSYALLSDGTVAAWGLNGVGQLGDGTTTSSARPVRVVSTSGAGVLSGVVAVAAGGGFALALLSNHTVVAWGYGADGELGNGATSNSSVPVVVHGNSGPKLTGIVAIAAGDSDSYAVTSAGTVYSWGYGNDGALGDNDMGNQSTPVVVAGVNAVGALSHVVSVSAGNLWSMALLSDGTMVTWGDNSSGQLGNGTKAASSVPVPVPGLGDIASIGTGSEGAAAFAVEANGAVFGWGANNQGQVGDGSATDQASPVPVASLRAGSGTVQVTAGVEFSAAVTASGTAYVWGDNAEHELGDGSTIDASTPTQPYAPGRIGLPKLFLRTAPVLGGHARVTHTLTVTPGVWGLPATSHGYQWLRDGKAIKGATKSSYKLTAADRKHHVSVRVSAGRSGYPSNSTTTRSVTVA